MPDDGTPFAVSTPMPLAAPAAQAPAAHDEPGSRHRSRHAAVAGSLAVVLLAGVAGGGAYVAGNAGGPDLHEARAAGARAGLTRGEVDGAQRGYKRGFAEGRESSYHDSYKHA